MSAAGVRYTAAQRSSSPIPIGAITSSFTNISTATTGRDWAPAIRPAGPGSWPNSSIFMAIWMRSGPWKAARWRVSRKREENTDMNVPRYPSLYQINTRVWLTELSRTLGRPATLNDIPDAELDRLAEFGFDWIWFLSVWQTGPGAQQVSRNNAEWRREFQETLPDLREEDIAGSGFAITGYTVHQNLGGDSALACLRERLRKRGLKLMLDFVPNHMGLDHPWVEEHPEYLITGTELDLARAPRNYTWVKRKGGDLLLAYGRDPYFAGWPDTLQLNYANPATHEAMIGELQRIAGQCDGVRCDMAMLVLPDVFERTWGHRAPVFWPSATQRVRQR